MRYTIIVLAALISVAASAAEIVGRVVRVADGDTLIIVDGSNIQYRVRLAKIDAPEKSQPFGVVSRNHLAGMVANGTVRVAFTARDKYGRIIGDISTADCERVNLQMIADGFAWHYAAFDNSPEYAAVENDARKNRRGLWSEPNPVPPWEWRKTKRTPRKKR